ncbi:MAG: FAD binding domain-containing protein [Bacteriovoracaceae bacterium]|nr:FAD binding domain-containing protein [Bacteriovoracaceae bacterium]
MRESVCFYINGKKHEVAGEHAFLNLSDYLRYHVSLPGTKVVCAEGDCGACTVLISSLHNMSDGKLRYRSINSCISQLFQLDLHSIITVEGIEEEDKLHEVQSSMQKNHGAQCGYCTPGFICAMAGMTDNLIQENQKLDEKKSKNYLTGNLCRCTGYDPILKACEEINLSKIKPLYERYHNESMLEEFQSLSKKPLKINTDSKDLFLPIDEEQAFSFFDEKSKITSGATDLGVLINKGKLEQQKIISFNNIQNFHDVSKIKNEFHIGPRATWSSIENAIETDLPEYTGIIRIFASPQIKNQGTLVGNIANASPIGDGIPYLMVNNSTLELSSKGGSRIIPVSDFYKGYKKLDLNTGEFIKKVILPIPQANEWTKLYKVSLRRDLDISAVTFAGVVELKGTQIKSIRIAFGGVGPIVLRVPKTEDFLTGKEFNRENIFKAHTILESEITPMSDLRGSKEFRMTVARNLLLKFHDELATEKLSQKVEVTL